MSRPLLAAITGIVAAATGIAVAELSAAATRPPAAPLVAVGGAVIDATPAAVKEFAVRELGTADKPVLLAGIAVVLAFVAAQIGVAAARWRAAAPAGALLLGAIGAAAALSRPASIPADALPSLLGAAIAGAILWWLNSPARPSDRPARPSDRPARPNDHPARSSDHPARPRKEAETGGAAGPGVPERGRRRILQLAALAASAAAAQAAGMTLTSRRERTASRSREAIRLPAATDPAQPLPRGAAADFTTANDAFYRVDTALTVPRVDPDRWRLRIHGMVDREIELSLDDLLRRPLTERDITLNCVSNEVGGPYIGTARWLGIPLATVLREAGIRAGADQIVARSVEGMTIGTPLVTALDGRDTLLAVGMNGEPLPHEHGFPVRMITPGLYGYAGACKWLTAIELTTFDRFDAYWVERGWSAQGTVKTASRIDRPKPFARVAAGPVTVAGVAWAQRRGIAAVEISVDGGPWNAAELLPTASVDTWVQWRYSWRASPGPHSLAVRATDGDGVVQPAERVTPYPDGATGRHTVTVTAG
ncbi:molybdopterin-dependent oxidoreductase [Actinoplanes sp. NPDC023714]|uniref:molybdopterin-dependent oxidoreductase n=1 Tax=Actinoplanes sp. NPDC023714 TaxID=3154322 RepID=UPI003400CE18